MNTEDHQYITHQIQYTYLLQAYRLLYQCCFLSRFLSLAAKEKSTSGSGKINSNAHQKKPVHKPMPHQGKRINSTILASGATYDSFTGRFLREDPQFGNVNEPPSLHRYLYAAANPLFYIDPNGEAAYAFDGTGQDRNTGVRTNVARLFDLYEGQKFYEPGVGTNENRLGVETAGALFGAGGDARLESMYQNLVNTYNGIGPNGKLIEPDTNIDLIGFSRGAALARAFANLVNERGIPDLSSARTVTVTHYGRHPKEITVYDNYFKPEIRSMALFDTVGSFGLAGNQDEGNKDLSIAPNVRNVRHAIARDEMRYGFPLTSVIDPDNPNDPRIKEMVFDGVHTDIGCCYADDESLSYDPLYWMWNELDSMNVPLDSLPPEYMPIPPHEAKPYKRKFIEYANIYVDLPQQGSRTVHDSRYWITDNPAPREVFYLSNRRSNDPTSKQRVFSVKTSAQHERFLQEIYGKNYQFISEESQEP